MASLYTQLQLGARSILYLQFLDNLLGVVTESLECKHISGLLTAVLKIKGLHFSRSVRPFYLLVLRD